jgi:iron complex outermembrane receptor protein
MLQDNDNVPGTQRIPFIPDFNSFSAGLFGVTKLYMDKWTIDLGARYDFRHFDVKGYDFKNTFYSSAFNFQNISATVGATIRAGKDQSVDVSLATAWRPPHVSELFSIGTHQSAAAIEYGLLLNDTTNEVMTREQAGFQTEQAVKFVSTYRKGWKDLTIEVSPYANYIFNYIYLRPEGITRNVRGVYPYFRYSQTDALFLGIDVTGTWQVEKHLKISPKASLLTASDERNDDYLVSIPSNKFEVSLRYEKPEFSVFKNFYIESKAKYVARQTRSPAVISVREIKEAGEQKEVFNPGGSTFDFIAAPQGYWLWDLSAGVSIKRDRLQYDFRIASENTLSETYREYTNRFRYYADDRGRNLILSFKCIF